MDRRQAEYLENMGVPVWVARERTEVEIVPEAIEDLQAADPQQAVSTANVSGLVMGPGAGARLFLCTEQSQQSGRLAADLARALPDPPVWAWATSGQPATSVAEAVDKHLFTTVAIFGEDLAKALLAKEAEGGELPGLIGPARIVVLPSMERLQMSAAARRECWQRMITGGVTGGVGGSAGAA